MITEVLRTLLSQMSNEREDKTNLKLYHTHVFQGVLSVDVSSLCGTEEKRVRTSEAGDLRSFVNHLT